MDKPVLIVGAGCFGLSTALWLLKTGYTDVTIIDKAAQLPALDGASNDINRVVRTSYSDSFYSKFCHEAIKAWNQEEFEGCYHESGVVVLGAGGPKEADMYADAAYKNDQSLGLRLEALENAAAIRRLFPPQFGTLEGVVGYMNHNSGWTHAERGIIKIMAQVTALGGKIIPGQTVKALLKQDGKTSGVKCTNGNIYKAPLTVIATGSWTASTFPELDFAGKFQATGQCVAMIQLSEEEAAAYRDCPVLLDFGSGFYCFPPNETNIVKMGIHAPGYTHSVQGISTPRTIVTDPERGLAIPKAAAKEIRDRLRYFYPGLAAHPFVKTRLCWYNDTLDDHWIIGYHPQDRGLVFCTGGSGHAYKFLPVIGSLAAKLIQGTLEPELVNKFAMDRKFEIIPKARSGELSEINLQDLCVDKDLEA
ncbi:FAD dependent oxidoreductase [Mycena floridula]|nr:FAD dependent oxidoreductase [Mycena floridula]